MITVLMVTTQLYMFLELDWSIEFPTYLFLSMIAVSLLTTFLFVHIPMRPSATCPLLQLSKVVATDDNLLIKSFLQAYKLNFIIDSLHYFHKNVYF